jgi:alpha-amylase/alpha-mannosidase (GH57 family)
MENMAFCVHGHFYQPPREDPLTGEIPIEPGAAPYRNWNERINAQCYRPNAQAGNFEHMSFNIGPTLMQWMAKHDTETMQLIIQQEKKNYARFGFGNGMAQSYNHTILPLANLNDKITQVRWGIADFEFYYGHKPEGMWLPETAADLESLQVMADCGIQFTILAPWQADTDNLDASHPYRVALGNEKDIKVFFYNQDLSTRISFDPGATVNADRFVLEGLMPKFREYKGNIIEPQLVMIASDGELYGHHQPFRDKFLAYLLDGALGQSPMESTFPALWMRSHAVDETIQIYEKSSWSCHHGVTRWMGSCGCAPNNEWKEPLRNSVNWLADEIDRLYVDITTQYVQDPWELRHRYIHVIHGAQTLDNLFRNLTGKQASKTALYELNLVLRAQFERQRMFTSCGWFFDDFDRIEPRNNIAYAAQAVWLMGKAAEIDLAAEASAAFASVRSWRTGLGADEVFRRHLARANRTWKDEESF